MRTATVEKPAYVKRDDVKDIRRAKVLKQSTSGNIGDSKIFEQINAIRHGIRADRFDSAADLIGLPKKVLAQKLGLSPRTLGSRKEILSPEESEKTLRTIEIFEQAVEVLGSESAAQDWMTSPAYGLENQTPIDLLDTDIGAAQVKGLLRAIKYGNVW
jgi:putative toxin-antitoxin system antitoxin component (TIGR02293 family)